MRKHFEILLVIAGLASIAWIPARADDEAVQLQNLLQKQAPSIVTIKTVLKAQAKGQSQGEDSDMPMTLQGVVVSPDGLIMLSNLPFSPRRWMEIMGQDRQDGSDVKVTPTALKVTFGQETQEYDAFVAATDTTLDLTFLQIEGLAGRKLPAVDFSTAPALVVGQKVVGIARLPKGYDYAPFFESARISGDIAKPRKAYLIDGGISGFGLPIFALTGEPVGVLTTIPSGVKDADGAGMMTMVMRFLTGGGTSSSVFVLPAQTVKGLIDQAGKRAVEVAAERAKQKLQKPTGAPAPTPAAPAKKAEKSGKP